MGGGGRGQRKDGERRQQAGARDAAGAHGRWGTDGRNGTDCMVTETIRGGPEGPPRDRTAENPSVRYFVHFWIVSTVCVLATAPSNVVV